ncbi:hypothetical protein [Nonomuraea sp. NPDC049480]|uniref:hypothetical protein n=1 Tax=Nonomuraea sp. NPDC049480 TaxID=3364353 RepID=UPI0037B29118
MKTRRNDSRSRATIVRRYGVRALAAGAALSGTLLAVAGPAHAASNVVVTGGGTLQIIAGNGPDNITVFVGAGGRLHVRNTLDVVPAVAPCVAAGANEVSCPAAGIVRIKAATRGGNDTLRNFTSLRSRADMGRGKDRFFGGTARDVVFGRAGDDVLNGLGGNDAANGGPGFDLCTAETRVLCP